MYWPTKRVLMIHHAAHIASQERSTRLNQLLAETLTRREAAERYDVSIPALVGALKSCEEWRPRPGAATRFFIADIEAVVERLRTRRKARTQRGDIARPLWFLDDTEAIGIEDERHASAQTLAAMNMEEQYEARANHRALDY